MGCSNEFGIIRLFRQGVLGRKGFSVMALPLLILFVLASLFLVGLSIPLAQGRVKPNRIYGVRLPLTLNNPDMWYKVNAYVGRVLLVCSVVMLAASVILYPIFGSSIDGYSIAVAMVMLACAVVSTVICFRYVASIRK